MTSTTTSIDRLDAALIGVLTVNARATAVELADALGVARNTVQARLARLEESGVLGGFVPRVDLAAVGAPIEVFAALAIDLGRFAEVVAQIATMPHVLEIHVTTGREDLLVRIAAASAPALQDLIGEIVSVPGVAHSSTSLVMTTPLPYRVQPLLEDLTRESGFGRSTPAPRVGAD